MAVLELTRDHKAAWGKSVLVPLQGGPLLAITRVVTPTNGLINGYTPKN